MTYNSVAGAGARVCSLHSYTLGHYAPEPSEEHLAAWTGTGRGIVDGSGLLAYKVGFSVGRASGNSTFDARVQSTMSAIVGQQLPPPPPLYPEILGSSVQATFSGKGAKCD